MSLITTGDTLKNIVTDCDGVVLDWHLGFYHWMRAKGETVLTPYPNLYAMTDAHPGKTKEQVFAEIPVFNTTPDFAKLTYCEGALDGILALKALFPEARIIVLTAVGEAEETKTHRRENLKGLPIDELILVPLHLSKRAWLEQIEGPAMFIEDHPGHAGVGAEIGMTSILIDRPWNRDPAPAGVIRAMGWPDIVEIARSKFLQKEAA